MLISLLRRAKHAGFVATTRARRGARSGWIAGTSLLWGAIPSRRTFDRSRYRRSFVLWDAPPGAETLPVPRRLFCLWTGDNPMSGNRLRSLDALREANSDLDVQLVTTESLPQWELPEHPIHPAYRNLSLVHRSDYLRAYLLCHHGGAYSDLKELRTPVGAYLDAFDDPDLWMVGYPEVSTGWVGQLPRTLGAELRRAYTSIPGGSFFIVRPGTPLVREWLAEVERRLDYYEELLEQNPGGVRNELPHYPIGWNKLLAQVMHPLAYKHAAHVRVLPELRPRLEDYQ